MAGLWPCVVPLPHPDGTRVVLRALRLRDWAEWEALRAENRAWLRPWEATSPHSSQARSGYRQLIRHYDREARAGRMQPFVIERAGQLVGQMHLFGIGWGALRGGAAGYWVAQRVAGQGIAPLCLAGLIDHAIYGLGLHRVEVNIRPENTASLRVVAKLRLRDEGVRKAFLHIEGAWRDHRTFAVTAEDLAGASLVTSWWSDQRPGDLPLPTA